MPGTLFVVATPIGNLEDISGRAIRVLSDVTLIAAEDTRRTAHLLTRYAIRTPTTSLNEHNEAARSKELVGRLLAGESIALVSDAGTPAVSDPGERLVREAVNAGIRVEPVPGPSAPLALLSVAGLPTASFSFLGFPPKRSEARKKWLQDLASARGTVLFFESPHRLIATLEAIRAYYGDCHIVVGRELTKVHEQVFRGTVSEAIRVFQAPIGEFVLAVNLAEQHRIGAVEEVSDDQILAIYAETRAGRSASKRQAAQDVARKLGLPPNRVYEVVERAKKSSM